MAAGSLLALLDDIATMLDDVSVMSQIAAKKTAGVLGDDLALNAQQVSGVSAERELPVVWAVAKGSFLNKLILVPAALIISYFAPWLITPLLMVGGTYLCFEGFEKISHHWLHEKEDDDNKANLKKAVEDPNTDLLALEKEKVKGAIRTDFILSGEIIVIALGTVKEVNFMQQSLVVAIIAIVMTIGVYGLVAGIVKVDDLGLHLMRKKGESWFKKAVRKIGLMLLSATPYLMRALTVLGTIAMFLVGGSIIAHGLPSLHHFSEPIVHSAQHLPMIGGFMSTVTPLVLDLVFGLFIGAVSVAVFTLFEKLKPKK
jgi:uncharacterized protein